MLFTGTSGWFTVGKSSIICIVTLPEGPFIHIYNAIARCSSRKRWHLLRHFKSTRVRFTVHVLIQREGNTTVSLLGNSNTYEINIVIPLTRIEGLSSASHTSQPFGVASRMDVHSKGYSCLSPKHPPLEIKVYPSCSVRVDRVAVLVDK